MIPRLDISGPRRALFQQVLGQRGLSAQAPITPRGAGVAAPASEQQVALWFLDRLNPGQPTYNIPCALRIAGPLDTAALAQAVTRLGRRHRILACRYIEAGGVPLIDDAGLDLTLQTADLRFLGADAAATAADMAREEARAPFDLGTGPAARFRLVRLAPDSAVLLITLHHIAADGWTAGLLLRELEELYRATVEQRDPALPQLSIDYGDFALWQGGVLRGDTFAAMIAAWKDHLGDTSGELQWGRPRAATTGEGRHLPVRLDEAATSAVRACARAAQTTPQVVLFAAWRAAVAALTGARDFAVGCNFAARTRPELDDLAGYFVNTLPVRTPVRETDSWRDVVAAESRSHAAVSAWQRLPFIRLVGELRPRRQSRANPLFQVAFNFLHPAQVPPVLGLGFNAGIPVEQDFAGLLLSPLDVDYGVSRFDAMLVLWDLGTHFQGCIEYDLDLLGEPLAGLARDRFSAAVAALAGSPDSPLAGWLSAG